MASIRTRLTGIGSKFIASAAPSEASDWQENHTRDLSTLSTDEEVYTLTKNTYGRIALVGESGWTASAH
jgi:hypothetical protein